jgi:hypothetical protein
MKNLKTKIEALEKRKKVSQYVPVLFLDGEDNIEEYKHLIGPETVVFIDNVGDEYENAI